MKKSKEYVCVDMHVHLGTSRDGAQITWTDIKSYMEKQRLSHVVVFPIDDPKARPSYAHLNTEIQKLASKNKRVIGFCRLNPVHSEEAHKELTRSAKMGLRGVKLHPFSDDFSPNQAEELLCDF